MNILCIVDRTGWCWTTTAREIASRLDGHIMRLAPPGDHDLSDVDMIWYRGYPFVCPGIATGEKPYIFGFTTGGAQEQERLGRCEPFLEKASGVLVQNSASYKALRSLYTGTVSLIPNGVDTDRFYPPDNEPDKFNVGMCSNVRTEGKWRNKGADIVSAVCSGEQLNIPLKIATPRMPPVETEAENLLLPHERIPSYLRSLSVFCQPSLAEGCSNSIMEAMACGRPCIICRTAGYHGEVCRDIRETEDGEVLFIDPGDQYGLAVALTELRDNPSMCRRMGENARAFAALHNWNWIARLYQRVFDEVLCER